MGVHRWNRLSFCAASAFAMLTAGLAAGKDSPSLRESLPAQTQAYVRIKDYTELRARLERTAVGRLSHDQELVEFSYLLVESLLDFQFPASAEALRRGELANLSHSYRSLPFLDIGEIVVALVPREDGELSTLWLVDAGDSQQRIAGLLDELLDQAEKRGASIERRKLDGAEVMLAIGRRGNLDAAFFRRGNQFGTCDDLPTLEFALRPRGARLTHDKDFVAALRALDAQAAAPSQVEFYVAPRLIEGLLFGLSVTEPLAESAGRAVREHSGGTAEKPPSPLGIKAFIGQIQVAEGAYDVLLQAECLLDSPRNGLARLVSLKACEPGREPWLPADLFTYATISFDLETSLRRLGAESERSAARNALPENVALPEWTEQLEGRFSQATFLLREAESVGQVEINALQAKSSKHAERLLEKYRAADNACQPDDYNGHTLWLSTANDSQPSFRDCTCLADEWLLFSNHPKGLRRALDALAAAETGLRADREFLAVRSRIDRLSGGTAAGHVFARPQELLRHWHELLTDEQFAPLLEEWQLDHPLIRAVVKLQQDLPLPAVEKLNGYLTPWGGCLTDTGGSLRITLFSLARNASPRR